MTKKELKGPQIFFKKKYGDTHQLPPRGCVAQLAERRSLAGELTLSFAQPAA